MIYHIKVDDEIIETFDAGQPLTPGQRYDIRQKTAKELMVPTHYIRLIPTRYTTKPNRKNNREG